MFVRLLQLNLIGLLLTISSCRPEIIPPPERGACVVTYPDGDICHEVPRLACVAAMGEYFGDGSFCEETLLPTDSIATEPSSKYLKRAVISSVSGILAILVVWIAYRRNRIASRKTR